MNLEVFFATLNKFTIGDAVRNRDGFIAELPSGESIEGKIIINEFDDISSIIDHSGTSTKPEIWLIERVARISALARSIEHATDSGDCAYISPRGEFNLSWSMSESEEAGHCSVFDKVREICETNNSWESHVVYLTSNAGEGKTTTLEKLANTFAKKYQPGRGKIILPISLSGKPFLRFEDIVAATLANKFKFPSLFYSSFIALVKLGVIIPAFDGFEEMFSESPSGEAISAMADLLKDLNGKGLILVAARSAYFEHKSLSTQGRLYNSINSAPVTFSKISISRWDKSKFIEYAEAVGYTNSESNEIYDELCTSLGAEHPILTRAVLVKKFFDAIMEDSSLDDFTSLSSSSPTEFFSHFVTTIIERESKKWLMKSGGIQTPVLTATQHNKLLSMIAREMWISRSEILRSDVIDTISEIFCESESLNAEAAWQLKNRIGDHAVLRQSERGSSFYEFDHQDFYHFFLAQSIAESISKNEIQDAIDVLRRARFPMTSLLCVEYMLSQANCVENAIVKFCDAIMKEQKSSFARENLALLVIEMNSKIRHPIEINSVSFETDPFEKLNLSSINFTNCIFSSIKLYKIQDACEFSNCQILEIEISSRDRFPAKFYSSTEISSIFDTQTNSSIYAPAIIQSIMAEVSLQAHDSVQNAGEIVPTPVPVGLPDENLVLIEKALRMFYSRIEVNEELFRQKLGAKFPQFWDDILPDLIGVVFERVQYRGGGNQERLRIICKLDLIQKAFELADNDYGTFLTELKRKRTHRGGF